jgi:H+/gluconate symporter-like permease
MTALPGTPAIQNAIPSPFFGTDAFAAPGLGMIAGLIGGFFIMRRRGVEQLDSGRAEPILSMNFKRSI